MTDIRPPATSRVTAGTSQSGAETVSPYQGPPRVATMLMHLITVAFVASPVVAVIGAVMLGLPPTLLDVTLMLVLGAVALLGVTIGWHRMLTHRSFRAVPWLRYALVWAGATSLEGAPIGWCAMHREHHQLSDQPGDPHSPYWSGDRQLDGFAGFWHAHVGWLFNGFTAKPEKFTPDLLADKTLRRIDYWWWLAPLVSVLLVPAVVGFVAGGVRGAVGCVLWAGLFRVGLVHAVTWAVNSICHTFGSRPYASRDKSTNVWWLAVVSGGESWHNTHHAFPTLARHGAEKGQWDPSARIIRVFERLGWVDKVHWPVPERLAAKRVPTGEAAS